MKSINATQALRANKITVATKLGITLPTDVRTLYLSANGTDGEFGECLWQVWAIDSEELTLASYLQRPRDFVVAPASRRINPAKYVRFADCFIDCPLYAYSADPDSPHFGEVIGCYTDGGTFDAFEAADSVSRFLELLGASKGEEPILIDEENAQPDAAPEPPSAAPVQDSPETMNPKPKSEAPAADGGR